MQPLMGSRRLKCITCANTPAPCKHLSSCLLFWSVPGVSLLDCHRSCSQNRSSSFNLNRQGRVSLGFGFAHPTSQDCHLSIFLHVYVTLHDAVCAYVYVNVCTWETERVRESYDGVFPSLDSTSWLTGYYPYDINSYIIHCSRACSSE